MKKNVNCNNKIEVNDNCGRWDWLKCCRGLSEQTAWAWDVHKMWFFWKQNKLLTKENEINSLGEHKKNK